jgi:transcriptional regulator with XRE-family HTH domain
MSTKKNVNAKVIDKLESIAGKRLTLGSLIKSIRLGEEMNQETFASLLGISKQYLCDIEKGRRIVGPKLAAKYAKILGYSENQFIRLCLQDILERDGFHKTVFIEAA